MKRTAVYPGTFDPMTLGHFDLVKRAAALYDRLVVAVAATSVKQGAMFDCAARMAMIREDVEKVGLANVSVEKLDTLLVDFCRKRGVKSNFRKSGATQPAGYRAEVGQTRERYLQIGRAHV